MSLTYSFQSAEIERSPSSIKDYSVLIAGLHKQLLSLTKKERLIEIQVPDEKWERFEAKLPASLFFADKNADENICKLHGIAIKKIKNPTWSTEGRLARLVYSTFPGSRMRLTSEDLIFRYLKDE